MHNMKMYLILLQPIFLVTIVGIYSRRRNVILDWMTMGDCLSRSHIKKLDDFELSC